jgi:hypothetical protein
MILVKSLHTYEDHVSCTLPVVKMIVPKVRYGTTSKLLEQGALRGARLEKIYLNL